MRADVRTAKEPQIITLVERKVGKEARTRRVEVFERNRELTIVALAHECDERGVELGGGRAT